MSAQPTTKPRGPNKVTQALAGVAGALAFLGIGWAMGTRSVAGTQAVTQPATVPATAPTYPITRIPGEWDDEGGQWGTIPQQGGTAPAQPGTIGGATPPQTGTTGSTVAQSTSTTLPAATGAVTTQQTRITTGG